ncbi:hypothetical protein [Arsukibacterium sp.]|nr:hypothetical protein [Arsukibacterium sp.]
MKPQLFTSAGLIADLNTDLTARSGGYAASSDSMMQGKFQFELDNIELL